MEKNIKEAISIIEDVRKSMPECTNKAFLKGALNELNEALRLYAVSGSLPMYDVEELNEIIKLFNNREIDLYTCIGRVWNKAYTLGCIDGSKGNDR